VRRRAAALLGLAAALACRSPLPVAPLPPDDPRPAAWLAELRDRGDEREGLRATARVSLSGQHGASFARQILVLERPARLRVEVLGILGQRALVLVTDGESYSLWRAETGGLEEGPVHPGILFEVAGVPLTPEDAVRLLLGAPALGDGAERAAGEALPDGGIRVRLEGAGAWHALDFDAAGRLRVYAVLAGDEPPLLRVAWDDYREVAGRAFAHRVDFDFPRADAHAEVELRRVELNPALPDGLFELDLPGVALGLGGPR
jgi:hypothetical protein